MDPFEAAALAFAAFIAGGVNAIAGGGTLIAFPALLAVGYDAKVANVTNTVAVWPGTVGGSWAYRGEILRQRPTITAIALPVAAGAVLGSALLLSTPVRTFEFIVPFLILFACALLALQDRLALLFFTGDRHLTSGRDRLLLQAAIFFVAIYGGYFGAAMGIIMLALFGLLLPENIQHANALKGLVSMAVNGIAVVYFGLFGNVAWEAGLLMAAFSLLGGYLGVAIARRLPASRLRLSAVLYGSAAALVLMFR